MKKKKYIKPVTVVIVTSAGHLLAGTDTDRGMEHGNSKENTSFGDESDDSESAPTTGWTKVGTAWDDEL